MALCTTIIKSRSSDNNNNNSNSACISSTSTQCQLQNKQWQQGTWPRPHRPLIHTAQIRPHTPSRHTRANSRQQQQQQQYWEIGKSKKRPIAKWRKNETKNWRKTLQTQFSLLTRQKAPPTFPHCHNIHNFLIFKKNICLYVDKFTTRASVNILG